MYLENNSIPNAFTKQRAKVLGMLAAQMTISLENAKFSALLESEKRYRTLAAELELRKKRLEEFIDTLCHELRNPLNGIYGNTSLMQEMLSKLTKILGQNTNNDNNNNNENNDDNKVYPKDLVQAFQYVLPS